eukprot:353596-Heterocapsa_arctica.AAC.1
MPSRCATDQRREQDGRLRRDCLERLRLNASGTRCRATTSWAERHADDRRCVYGVPARPAPAGAEVLLNSAGDRARRRRAVASPQSSLRAA